MVPTSFDECAIDAIPHKRGIVQSIYTHIIVGTLIGFALFDDLNMFTETITLSVLNQSTNKDPTPSGNSHDGKSSYMLLAASLMCLKQKDNGNCSD